MGLLDRLLGRAKKVSRPAGGAPGAFTHGATSPSSFAIIDVETTGLSPRMNRVVELAIVRVDSSGQILDEWSSRFNPEGPVGATHIHGITQSDVDRAPLFRDLAGTIASRLSGLPIAAHNARFDLQFMRYEFDRAGWDLPRVPSFCTLDGSHHYLPNLDRRRLADCCWAANVQLNNAHSALGDARATAGLLQAYLGGIGGVRADTSLLNLPAQARAVIWPSSPTRLPSATPTLDKAVTPTKSRTARPVRFTPARPAPVPLIRQISSLTLAEVMDEGAPLGALAYLELLLDSLADGDISEEESNVLVGLAAAYELSTEAISATHDALLQALAHRAVDDGHVSRLERAELDSMAALLSVPSKKVMDVIRHADSARVQRMSAGLKDLPSNWSHGEPLRVGDRVAFTGCDERQRERLEKQAENLGVRVLGNVSRLTAMLITDDSFSGTKAAKAGELGTRLIHPDQFKVLLTHLQPALTTSVVTKPQVQAQRTRSEVPANASPSRRTASPSMIRSWALAQGYEVGIRGRLPEDVVEAYTAATGTY